MRFTLISTVLAGLAFGLPVFGDAIVISNTGESGGAALPTGDLDPNYSLISAPAGVPLTATTTSPDPAWTNNTATADWISPGPTGDTGWPVGLYEYQITFSLAGLNPATAQLSGEWTSDNNASIDLNGVSTGITSPFAGFGSLSPFSITSGFQSGVNTLGFLVENGGGPTGLFVEVSGTAAASSSTVPEPSSIALLLGGLAFVGVGARRRRI